MTPEAGSPSPELARLDVFIGKWKTEGRIFEGSSGAAARLDAIDTYEWLPGGFFLVHHVDGRMGEAAVQAIEIIGFDTARGRYVTHSFDNQGNAATYEASLSSNNVWSISGDSERFRGVFGDGGKSLTGQWERAADSQWVPWMEIRLTKM